MSSGIINYPKFKAFDTNGAPLAGGRLYAYKMGTTTPKDTYTSVGLSVPNTNPVVLDSLGEAVVFGSGTYKLALADSGGVTIWTFDGVEFAAAGAVRVSNADTTAGFLEDKLVAGTNVLVTKQNAGSNESLRISLSGVLTSASIGTTVQAYDAQLAAIAGLTSVSGKSVRFTSVSAEAFPLTNFALTLLDDADAAAMRTTLGVPASFGAWAYVSSATANNSASVEFTGLSSGYDYAVVCDNAIPQNAQPMLMQVGTGAGPTYITANYHQLTQEIYVGGGATDVIAVSSSAAACNITGSAVKTAGNIGVNFEVLLQDVGANVNKVGSLRHCVYSLNVDATTGWFTAGYMFPTTSAITAVKFYMATGNIVSGVFRLYRRAKS